MKKGLRGGYMGALGALYLGLFVWCLQKKQEKAKIKERLITLLLVGVANVLLAIILSQIGKTAEDREGGWAVIIIYFLIFGWRIVLDIISLNGPNTDASAKESTAWRATREQRWLAQEAEDKELLNRNDDFANRMLYGITTINAIWECDTHLYEGNENSEFRSRTYILALTPQLFLDNYYVFKSCNYGDIKDKIYTERPYPVLDTLIKMGIFIFESKNNLFILKEIINEDREEYINSKALAQRILNQELQEASTDVFSKNKSESSETKRTAAAFKEIVYHELYVGPHKAELESKIQLIKYINYRFGIKINVNDSLDTIKKRVSYIESKNPMEWSFVCKVKKCKSVEELIDIF